MKGFKKRLTPMNHRGASPSFSSTSSASSSYGQPFGQQHVNQHAFTTSGKPDRSNISPTDPSPNNHEIVIRALRPFHAQRPERELSVNVGDFLQVIGEAWLPDGSGWFQAINPYSGARGLVPIHIFQVFSSDAYQPSRPPKHPSSVNARGPLHPAVPRNPKPIATHQQSRPSLPSSHLTKKSPTSQSLITRQPLYGVVSPHMFQEQLGISAADVYTPPQLRYDFTPQRGDELQAEKGEAIVLIAHSHQDWFVAKPIGRLGGPGLIPVSYVEVKDLATGKGLRADAVRKLMQENILPGIEEWKQATAAYRGNSIPLGRFENPTATTAASQNISATLRRGMAKSHQQLRSKIFEVDTPVPRPSRANIPQPLAHVTLLEEPQPVDIPRPSPRSMQDIMMGTDPMRSPEPVGNLPQLSDHGGTVRKEIRPEPAEYAKNAPSGENRYATVEDLRQRYGLLTHASVESFHKEQVQFWFHLRAHFSSPSSTNPQGEETTVLVLYRLYEDFFEFHAELMDVFPEEAGRQSYDKPSIFPKLPEPKDHTDVIVCAERVHTLSTYLQALSQLPSYIRDSEIFYEFLGPREGDMELQQESTPSVGSPESAEKPLMDEVQPLNQHHPATSPPKNPSDPDNASPHQLPTVPPSPLKKPSTPKSGESASEHSLSPSGPSHVQNPPAQLTSPTPKPGHKTHASNFSSSSTGSLMEGPAAHVHPPHLPDAGPRSAAPELSYRIKVHQENSADVIAIKATPSMSRAELLQKVAERVNSFALHPNPNPPVGKLFLRVPHLKQSSPASELTSDHQLSAWLQEFHSRLVLLYTPAD